MLKWLLYVKVVTPLSSTERFNILSDHCLVLQPRLFSSSLVIFIIVFPGSSRELLSFTNLWQTHCTWPAQHQTPETGWWRKWFSLAPHYQSVCYHFTATSSLCANQLPLLITIIQLRAPVTRTLRWNFFFSTNKRTTQSLIEYIQFCCSKYGCKMSWCLLQQRLLQVCLLQSIWFCSPKDSSKIFSVSLTTSGFIVPKASWVLGSGQTPGRQSWRLAGWWKCGLNLLSIIK